MSQEDTTRSERSSFGKSSDKLSYHKFRSEDILRKEEIEKHNKDNYEKYGNLKGLKKKSIDIDTATAYRMGFVDDVTITSDSEAKTFDYGMYDGANLQLDTMAKYGYIPERIKNKIINKKLSDKTLPNLTLEQLLRMFNDKEYVQNMINDILEYVGERDAVDEKIIFEQLPESLKDNEFYLRGYNKGNKKGGR